MTLAKEQGRLLDQLRTVLDGQRKRYKELAGAADFEAYLANKPDREDEEMLVEPVLEDLMEIVLGFPKDGYFAQFSRGGLKPDLTPMDPIAHPFVLDAKSSLQTKLDAHEKQIRDYVKQRNLRFGVLFNLREVRVYRAGQVGHDPELSFELLPLWELASGQAMVADPHLERFAAFAARFAFRQIGAAEKVEQVRHAAPWVDGEESDVEVDVDFLVDQLRKLSRQVTDDAFAQTGEFRKHLKLNPGRERALLGELEALAQDLEPGTSFQSLPDSVEEYIEASSGLPARIWRQYLLRVAHLALSRILLYRAWEDARFATSFLYDGGFGNLYDELDQNLRGVLDRAFAEGLQHYHWLYGPDNNYAWYRPSEDALIDVLYALTPFPLGKLDADVLGGLYESYVEEIDRDRLGQFFTPRAVVRFMMERAGFAGPEGVFRLEGNERKPVKVLDFATGSGGFLVEAARRIIDQAGISDEDAEGLVEELAAIVGGLHGCEISPFPYYLTEINLLLQVSRLLGKLALAGTDSPGPFTLGAVHADTLAARSGGASSIEDLPAEQRADEARLTKDERFGLVPLDAQKQHAFDRIREDDAFDLVTGNPPYVFETNNRLLFNRLRSMPAWKTIYRGKSDYLYYFLYLAAEKVAPGGKLCVITPAGWMNAGNADWLREHVVGTLRLDELYLFGSYRLFAPELEARRRRHRAPTPTVESAILVATKAKPRKEHKLRVVALESEAEAAKTLGVEPDTRIPDRDRLLAQMAKRALGKPGRRDGIHVHDVPQSELVSKRPWPIKHAAEDVAARVVAHLQAALDDSAQPVERLAERWSIPQGVQTGADAYTQRIQRRLERSFPEVKATLDAAGAKTGDPVMELPAGEEKKPPWSDHPEVLAKSIEPEAILYGAMDEDNYTSLVWLGRNDEAPSAVIKALERWKPLLEHRADFLDNPERRWWETHRTRDKSELRKPKVIALYRTDRGRFAVDEEGEWQPSIKTTLVIPREEGLSVGYVCGLLNSELLDLWYAVRGKTPWHVRRNYEPKPMAEIPYRHVDLTKPTGSGRVQELETALSQGGSNFAAALADAIGAELKDQPDQAREAAQALETIVRGIAANRRQLLPYRPRFPDLGRIVKDPWRAGPVGPDVRGFVSVLPRKETVSVRVDPELEVSIDTDGVLGRPGRPDGELAFTRQKQVTARVQGPPERLDLLAELLESERRLLPADLKQAVLPRDVTAFEQGMESERLAVEQLLDSGRILIEAAERLVCRLYGAPSELEDEVVAHAVARTAPAP